MKHTIGISKRVLIDELNLPDKAIEDTIIDQDRWTLLHEIVFEYNGKYYTTQYSKGATELQDESPWEFEDSIECYEVEQKEVTKIEWVEVE